VADQLDKISRDLPLLDPIAIRARAGKLNGTSKYTRTYMNMDNRKKRRGRGIGNGISSEVSSN
jgi:hypothetical protein